MTEISSLAKLVRRVRTGDPDAAVQLVREFEPFIRRAVRIQMRDPRLRRAFDPDDICQSVLRSFFTRLALGQYEFDQPQQLIRLLEAMARNKVASQARKAQVTRRDESDPVRIGGREPTDPAPESWRVVAGQDLLDAVRSRLTDDERLLSDLRAQGRAWGEIAAEVGSTPEALRKRLDRAMDRIAVQLGIDCFSTET